MIGELTNHLFQSTLFAVVAGLLTITFRKNRAQVRYWLWLSASLKFLVPFSLPMSLGNHLQWMPVAKKIAASAVSTAILQITQPFPNSPALVPSAPGHADWTPAALLAVWFCGFAVIALIRAGSWRRIRAAVRSSTPIGMLASMQVRSSPGLLEPGVVGLFRPILLLPAGIAECLDPPQLEAVLAHELCHVRRRDNLTSAIHMIVEALFWFHPLVWWIGSRLVEERERACDEAVLTLGSEPHDYAEGILNVCRSYLESPLSCASGVTGSDLKKRIHTILTGRIGRDLTLAKKLTLLTGGIAVIGLPILVGVIGAAQPAGTRPAFDVTSVKPRAGSAQYLAFRGDPGGVHLEGPLSFFIRFAYAVQDYQLEGGPGWIHSDMYVVEGKAAATHSPKEMRSMLQTMLEDRFALKMHRETKEGSVYSLVVTRKGSKMKPWIEGSCVDSGLGKPLEPGAIACGYRPGTGTLDSQGVAVAALADFLSSIMGRPVVDKTGLTGRFDFHLEYKIDQATAGFQATDSNADDNRATIFTALQEQLGLQLKSGTGPCEYLVIDNAEKPSEN